MPRACILAVVLGPTPWNFATEQGRDKCLRFFGHDRELAIWFTMVRCDRGEELVAGDSGGGREPSHLVYSRPDFLGGLPGGWDALEIVGDVEIGFIERERLTTNGV